MSKRRPRPCTFVAEQAGARAPARWRSRAVRGPADTRRAGRRSRARQPVAKPAMVIASTIAKGSLLEQHAVLEGAGLGLVGVADQVVRPRRRRARRPPTCGRWGRRRRRGRPASRRAPRAITAVGSELERARQRARSRRRRDRRRGSRGRPCRRGRAGAGRCSPACGTERRRSARRCTGRRRPPPAPPGRRADCASVAHRRDGEAVAPLAGAAPPAPPGRARTGRGRGCAATGALGRSGWRRPARARARAPRTAPRRRARGRRCRRRRAPRPAAAARSRTGGRRWPRPRPRPAARSSRWQT